MTGVLWFKLQTVVNHPIKREFPGVAHILNNNFSDVCDKNKIPLASIRASLDLAKDQESDELPFLFVVENVSLDLTSEEIQMQLSAQLGH
jgi:hypothetical protein